MWSNCQKQIRSMLKYQGFEVSFRLKCLKIEVSSSIEPYYWSDTAHWNLGCHQHASDDLGRNNGTCSGKRAKFSPIHLRYNQMVLYCIKFLIFRFAISFSLLISYFSYTILLKFCMRENVVPWRPKFMQVLNLW